MHAKTIIQKFLENACKAMHAKRRKAIAEMGQASSKGGLSLMGISRYLEPSTRIRHRIKRCDRLLSNPKLQDDKIWIYRSMTQLVLRTTEQPTILIDWSDLSPDRRVQLLRASVAVKGRAVTLYEEIHPVADYAKPHVHRHFLHRLIGFLPEGCRPILITDAGFRSPWFQLLDSLGLAYVGRIRNRDRVRAVPSGEEWQPCKTWYQGAHATPEDLGLFEYVRSNPVLCRLVRIKSRALGRHRKGVLGQVAKSRQSLKKATAQREPWLLAVSLSLSAMSAAKVVALYRTRMQIEEAFRDLKSTQFGLGLSESRTRDMRRYAALLLIGALVLYAYFIIGIAVKKHGYTIEYGSRKKAAQTLSLISLARWWLREEPHQHLSEDQLNEAIITLRSWISSSYF